MTSRSECIITGCALQNDELFVSGDLHEMGDVWIFNANTDAAGETAWYSSSHYNKLIDITWLTQSGYFERRGVFIFQRDTSLLNEAAKQYIGVAE